MTGPHINVDVFRHRPVNEVSALLPDPTSITAVLAELPEGLVDPTAVQVLQGDEGVRIFDRTGEEHGFRSRLVRFFQQLGYDQNMLLVHEEGLKAGEALVTIPCSFGERLEVGRALRASGAHAIIYFGPGTAETLTAP
ncbi:hypothetical protein N802_00280 [Knoellia sinensis KCTC 19936]|uniref:Uncharacterized protein n=1 Tax=Knoellia sinensis KCTC 19936 TaxID=1385520 RepID=A0A0A0JDX1_9MICO|nr:hypothetical protein [Knoellia sinensis]KGN34979.1 hypothetical protein N802_00280 [Knoellia sinensis KCTC 19936]